MPCNATNSTCVAGAQKLLRAGQLHKQAETALLRRLGKDPRDAGALLRLGDLHRRMGNFPAAAEAYSRLRALQPGERRASWLHAVTTGEQLPAAPPNGLRAAPFVHVRNFLSHAERERLLSAALAMRGRFRPGGTGLGTDRKVRSLVRRWYNGYNWLGEAEEKVYNPFDILLLFDSRRFKAHWFEIGSPKFLIDTLMRCRFSSIDLDGMVTTEALLSAFEGCAGGQGAGAD